MLQGKRIILGVTGGIAAYKAVFLLRELQKSGAEVRVTMTPSATRFVGVETFAALSRQDVAVEVFTGGDLTSGHWTRHIEWGEWAELFVIAPCTANTLAKIVHGFSDNMLTSVALAARCPILICPTMDGGMYRSPATQSNITRAREMSMHILEPDSGYLASGLDDQGRLPEPGVIISRVEEILADVPAGPLAGKQVVVTAGPTREFLDPVRFISNPSSGKMGLAMAEAAKKMGARVTLIHGPVSEALPGNITNVSITSASDLFDAVKKHHHADIFILAAAVSDFSPATRHQQKVKKDQAESTITLQPTPDTLQWLGDNKKPGQVLVGFAMETENLLESARSKRKRKNCDWIVANSILEEGSGFAHDTNSVYLISEKTAPGSEIRFEGSKSLIADNVLKAIFTPSR
ncbi:MAG: bifunctional phosphopantothenoylcysteine decarboxylase/phosphopantothenate--cysteine ligase CoaBC [Cyclonatronaceae bacterium]